MGKIEERILQQEKRIQIQIMSFLMKGCDYMEDGVWRTIAGRRVFIKEGQSLSEAMKESGKFKEKETTKLQEYVKKEDELNPKLDGLEYDELNEIFNKTTDPDMRDIIMNKMQEKDVVRFGREIYGIEMNDIDYQGSFDDALKYVNDFNKDKEYKTMNLYHGTNAKFEKFNYDHFGQTDPGDYGQGIYLTKNKQTASKYGKDVKEVEVKYKNALVINNEQDYQKHAEFFGDKYGEAKSLYNSKQRSVAIMKQGYDAVIDNVYGQVIIYDLNNTNIKK